MSTETAWETYNAAADAAGATDLVRRNALDNAVAALVRAERVSVLDQLSITATHPDGYTDVVRPAEVTT